MAVIEPLPDLVLQTSHPSSFIFFLSTVLLETSYKMEGVWVLKDLRAACQSGTTFLNFEGVSFPFSCIINYSKFSGSRQPFIIISTGSVDCLGSVGWFSLDGGISYGCSQMQASFFYLTHSLLRSLKTMLSIHIPRSFLFLNSVGLKENLEMCMLTGAILGVLFLLLLLSIY